MTKFTPKRVTGCLLIVLGVLVVGFSHKIVFPGLERLFGVETIVGKGNVAYQPGGGYLFTNPGTMIWWVLSVAAVGVLMCLSGAWLLFRAGKYNHASPSD
jgi:hypothetical protein